MATKGTSQAVLVDEFIFNAATSSVSLAISVAEHDQTNIASSAMEYTPGLPEWRLTQNGYFVGGNADGFADELHDRLGATGAQVAHLPDRTSTNTPAYVIPDAFNAALPIDAPVDGLITMSGEWAASAGGHRGKLITYNTTITSVAPGTSIDLGSAGSAGGHAYLFVHAIDGSVNGTSTDTVINVGSSATEGGTYDVESTFTFSATGGYARTMTGTVNRWLRINTTDLGGATSVAVTAIVVVTNVTE